MAKKSAVSKGYRKTVKKKPFLSKNEIIALIVIVAAIVLAVVLFNLFYDDGYLSASQVQPGDVVSYATNKVKTRYAKVAEINDLEGFTREDKGNDTNAVVTYAFTPDEETDHIDSVSVYASYLSASTIADSTISYLTESMPEDSTVQVSEKMETEIQGYPAYCFGYTSNYYDETLDPEAQAEAPAETEAPEAAGDETDAPAEDAEEPKHPSNVYSQNLSCYVQYDNSHSLCLHIYRKGEDESFYLPDDQLVDYLMNYTGAFTMVQPEAE